MSERGTSQNGQESMPEIKKFQLQADTVSEFTSEVQNACSISGSCGYTTATQWCTANCSNTCCCMKC